jgi:hypothetical protein
MTIEQRFGFGWYGRIGRGFGFEIDFWQLGLFIWVYLPKRTLGIWAGFFNK